MMTTKRSLKYPENYDSSLRRDNHPTALNSLLVFKRFLEILDKTT
jgi:hypothetical protein